MAFSVHSPVGDGVTTQFAVSFTNGLYSRDNVHVFVGDEETERTFTWINDGLIDVQGTVPAAGETVTIRRIMDKTNKAADFADGEILTERTLDLSVDQLLNISHEFLDGYGLESLNIDVQVNGNDLVNVGNLDTSALTLNGVTISGFEDLKGEKGDKGDTGATGAQGIQGPIGATGAQGIQGDAGTNGTSFTVNATGLDAGRSTYDNEDEGFAYLATDTGQLYIREGAVGNWSAGVPFGTGPQGVQGIQGIQGETGATGPQGPTGPAGADGADGADVNPSGTYPNLRAQATTKSDVGLSNVGNYTRSSSVTSNSTGIYATTALTNDLYNWLPRTASAFASGQLVTAYKTDTNAITAGSTYSGSGLRAYGITVVTSAGNQYLRRSSAVTTLSGTWRALTTSNTSGAYDGGLFVRIS